MSDTDRPRDVNQPLWGRPGSAASLAAQQSARETAASSELHAAWQKHTAIWWRRAVIYRIYPLSFQDSNGDGLGDLRGLMTRLDHLSWLGVDAVWLGPVYRSPMVDFGYDIVDFNDVDPVFGSLIDFDRLLAAVHGRGIRLILDFVPNHTSDRHPWFVASRSSRSSERRDWYVWADPAPDGGPPNRWLSRFGGSAWEWHAPSGQYYYHAFLKEQPDLNWRNPAVRAAMADALRFWLRRGVDGFRIDAAAVLAEDECLRDDPPNHDADQGTPPPDRRRHLYTNWRPEVIDGLAELRRVADEFPGRVLLGEVDGSSERIADLYGSADRPLLHLPLNYRLPETPWTGTALAGMIDHYLKLVPPHGWPNWLLGGHDKQRIANVVGQHRIRLAAMLLLTLPGTPVLYQGDELGMKGAEVPSDRSRDPFERPVPGYGLNRDPERAPMAWGDGENAGFTSGDPWLPLADDNAGQRTVNAQHDDPGSPMALYRALIQTRAAHPVLIGGACRISLHGEALLAYTRGDPAAPAFLVILNLGPDEQVCSLPEAAPAARLLLSTWQDRHDEPAHGSITLRGHEGLILRLA